MKFPAAEDEAAILMYLLSDVEMADRIKGWNDTGLGKTNPISEEYIPGVIEQITRLNDTGIIYVANMESLRRWLAGFDYDIDKFMVVVEKIAVDAFKTKLSKLGRVQNSLNVEWIKKN